MWNKQPPDYYTKLPKLYETEHIDAKDKIIYEHFFIANTDFYAAEYDLAERLFFGYVILGGDFQNAEWGPFDLDSLESLNINGFEIDRDLYWQPKKASAIEKICWGEGWKT